MNPMRLARKALLAVCAGALALSAVGCSGVSVSYTSGYYYDAWYDVYGNYCGSYYDPTYGCVYYRDYGGSSYYYDTTYGYGDWYYDGGYYDGWAYWGPDGHLYDQWGYAIAGVRGQGDTGRDMISDLAEQAEQQVGEAGKIFSDRYALSEKSGRHIAQTLHDLAILGKNGGRSVKDYEAFTKKLFGIDPNKAKIALAQAQTGDTDALVTLNTDIATFWGTDPETSQEIARNWGRSQLSKLMKQ